MDMKGLLAASLFLASLLSGIPVWLYFNSSIFLIQSTAIQQIAAKYDDFNLSIPINLHVFIVSQTHVANELISELEVRIQKIISLEVRKNWACSSVIQISVSSIGTKNGCLSLSCRNGGDCLPSKDCSDFLSKVSGQLPLPDDEMDDLLLEMASANSRNGNYSLFLLLGLRSSNDQSLTAFIGKFRHAWIHVPTSEQLVSNKTLSLITMATISGFLNAECNKFPASFPVSADGSLLISFTLINANPNDRIFHWRTDEIEKTYFHPMRIALAPFAALSFESQIVSYFPVDLSIKNSSLSRSIIEQWERASTVRLTEESTVVAALYIPALSQKAGSTGFGAVAISDRFVFTVLEASELSPSRTIEPANLVRFMGQFLAHFRSLLGLSPGPIMVDRTSVDGANERVVGLPARLYGFSQFEIDGIVRRKLRADFTAAVTGLRTLLELLQKVPSIPVSKELRTEIDHCGNYLENSKIQSNEIGDADMALSYTSKAHAKINEILDDPSLIPPIYFAPQHYLAVYLPLLLPLFLNAVSIFVRELRRFVSDRKKMHSNLKQD